MTTLDKMLQGLANALGASLSTLTTTAKTIVGAINELDAAVSSHTSTIGSGSLDTTSQTLIGAVNEINTKASNVTAGSTLANGSATITYIADTDERYSLHYRGGDFTLTKWTMLEVSVWVSDLGSQAGSYVQSAALGRVGLDGESAFTWDNGTVAHQSFGPSGAYAPGYSGISLWGSSVPTNEQNARRIMIVPPGQYCFLSTATTATVTQTISFKAISIS